MRCAAIAECSGRVYCTDASHASIPGGRENSDSYQSIPRRHTASSEKKPGSL
jgi:hypothetical protein